MIDFDRPTALNTDWQYPNAIMKVLEAEAERRALQGLRQVAFYAVAREFAERVRPLLAEQKSLLVSLEHQHDEILAQHKSLTSRIVELGRELAAIPDRLRVDRGATLVLQREQMAREGQGLADRLVELDRKIPTVRQTVIGMENLLRRLDALALPEPEAVPGLVEFIAARGSDSAPGGGE
jgi:chromosome segregation ATPase